MGVLSGVIPAGCVPSKPSTGVGMPPAQIMMARHMQKIVRMFFIMIHSLSAWVGDIIFSSRVKSGVKSGSKKLEKLPKYYMMATKKYQGPMEGKPLFSIDCKVFVKFAIAVFASLKKQKRL